MPKINQEKTNQLQEQQSQSIDSLFSKTKNDTSECIKNILKQHLWDPNNAKYCETLKILKYARNNKYLASKLFTKNMVKTIEEFSDLGMNSETINDIISIIYDKKCNYYNTEAKIKALWNIDVMNSERVNETNLEKQMKVWIWWTCSDLSTYVYNKFLEKKLVSRIQKETKKETILWKYGGSCDKYFLWLNWQTNEHLFLKLTIWTREYIVDPSFGILSNIKNTKYECGGCEKTTDADKNKCAWYADEKIQTAGIWKISINKWLKRIECTFEWIPLWFLSGTDVFLGLGFAENDYGKMIPMIAGTTADSNYWVYFIKDDELWYIHKSNGDIFWHRKKNIPQDIHQKLKNILMGLMKYSKDDDIEEKEEMTEIPIYSGIVLFYNKVMGRWSIKDDVTQNYIHIEGYGLNLKDGQPVNYIEVDNKAIITTSGIVKIFDEKNKRVTITLEDGKDILVKDINLSLNEGDKVDFIADKNMKVIAIQKIENIR